MRLPCPPAWLFLALSLLPPRLVAAPPEPLGELPGTLVLGGGGKLPDAARDRFVELAGGRAAHLVAIPTAGSDADAGAAEKGLDLWRKYGVASVRVLHTRSRDQANDAAFVKALTEATGVWLADGEPTRLTAAYAGTVVQRELQKLLARGGVLGGDAAGTAIVGPLTLTGDNLHPAVSDGFGLLPGFVVDPHTLRRNRVDRLFAALASHPGVVGVGIDEDAAVVLQGRRLSVLGTGYAVTCLASGAGHSAGVQVLHAGEQADLIALSRATVERTQPPFPPAKPAAPEVARGTLVIGGGGGLPDDLWQRFIDSGGGPDALLVVIPTALEDPVPADPVEARLLRHAGARNVKVLHTRKRAEADSAEFAAPLRKAGGVWFGGGRQWHFVDAYEGTAAEKAFHAVLERGGVIGGSSAGASIQAEYMARGDPLGNLQIMAEGYEHGFRFLPGVAIDQHFFKRQRFQDMTELMATYPQLLGIGIDEGTALVVRGSIMEVIGKSQVAVYDRRRPVAAGDKDYEVLPAGARYDMKKRQRLDKQKE
jgi:cyanophycinase